MKGRSYLDFSTRESITKIVIDMTTTLTVSFQIKTLKLDKKNLAPIYCRITLNGIRKEFAIGRSIDPNKWNKIGLAKGTTEEAKSINAYLTTIRLKLNELYRQI